MSTGTILLPTLPPLPPLPPERAQRAAAMLQRIGWEPAQLVQIGLNVPRPPAAKVAQMVRIRHQMMLLLRARLAAEHPTLGPADLNALLRAHIDQYYRCYS